MEDHVIIILCELIAEEGTTVGLQVRSRERRSKNDQHMS